MIFQQVSGKNAFLKAKQGLGFELAGAKLYTSTDLRAKLCLSSLTALYIQLSHSHVSGKADPSRECTGVYIRILLL